MSVESADCDGDCIECEQCQYVGEGDFVCTDTMELVAEEFEFYGKR